MDKFEVKKIVAAKFSWIVAVVVFALLNVNACGGECIPNGAGECMQAAAQSGQATQQNSDSGSSGDTAPTGIPDTRNVPTIDDINHIVVVTGQSNVEAAETAFDPHLDHPDPSVFAYTDSGWQVADLHQVWDENAHPGNHSLTDSSRSPNNNFVFHYAKSMSSTDPDAVVAFIVLADPGKGIANWDYESGFYWKMRQKITRALDQIPHRNTIDVMLWHQGESDAQYEGTSDEFATGFTDEDSPEYKNYYQIKLRNVINNFRSESWTDSDMPFICGETRISFRVNRRLMELNEDDDPNTACVKTTDLPYRLSDPSGAHYNAAGLRELGQRYMRQYLEIIGR